MSQSHWNQQSASVGYAGQPWLVEERDACGVGFIADCQGRASHDLIVKALAAVTCMEHRGGCSADQDSGDGAGLMTAVPWGLLQDWLTQQKIAAASIEHLGVGMVFLPAREPASQYARQIVEQAVTEAGLQILGWRVVPVRPAVLGIQARENQPEIEQILVQSDQTGDALERQLYLARKRVQRSITMNLATHPECKKKVRILGINVRHCKLVTVKCKEED